MGMSPSAKSLSILEAGKEAIVSHLELDGLLRRRILDLGIVPGTPIRCVGKAPAGDPIAYYVRGTVIALRIEDASSIYIYN